MEYIDGISDAGESCFLCDHRDSRGDDAKNHVFWRRQHTFLVLNRFPYTSGHCMAVPNEHTGKLSDLSVEALKELMELARDAELVLRQAINAEGFNIGLNIGRCAGAGLPGHLHVHIVPRWSGDTNFMPVLSKVRVIPQLLDQTYSAMAKAGEQLGMPPVIRK